MSDRALRHLVTTSARAERRGLSVSALASVLKIGSDLARPWPLAFAVDQVIDGRPWPAGLLRLTADLGVPAPGPGILLVGAGFASVALTGASALLASTATRHAEQAAERIGADLRYRLFGAVMDLSLRWHQRIRSGELVSRLTSDVGRLLDAVVASTATLVPDLVAVVGVLVLLLVIDARLALLGLLVVPVLALLSARQRQLLRASQREARTAAGRLSSSTTDLVRNVAAVQAFGRVDLADRTFADRNHALLGAELSAVDVEARWRPRADLVLAVGAALVLVVGGLGVLDGTQTTGHLLVVLAYLGELYAPVRGLTRLSAVLAKAGASATRVDEVLRAGDEPGNAVLEAPGARPLSGPVTAVCFTDVTFGYDPERPVLKAFDLTVHRGETVCLFGPSGIGKSTVLGLLLRLWDVDAGAVALNGHDVRELTTTSLRQAIAYVPQDPWLLDATLAQNIAFGSRRATRAGVLAAGRATLVSEFVDRLPHGWDEPLGEGGVRLSGGQRRRVALARAAVSDASLLLLDEPTASLDAAAAAGVVDAIRAARAGRTTLLVTHDPLLAALADRVVVLDDPTAVAPAATTSPERR